jgi:RHS repeat-associated protein
MEENSSGKERDAETGLDYFGARYYSGAQGRFTSPDAVFVDQYPAYPQSWNLYAYTRNNPLKHVDPDGMAIILAEGIENHDEVSDTVSAILQNPDTRSELEGYAGNENPDLLISSGDLSSQDTRQTQNGTTITTTVSGNFVPAIQTTTINGIANSTLTGAAIVIDNRVSRNGVPGVLLEEVKHAGDARHDPAGFEKEVAAESKKEHDLRTTESRSIEFSQKHVGKIAQQARQIHVQQERIKRFLRRQSQ